MAVVTPELLTVDEAARALRQSRVSVYRWVKRGELRAFRLGQVGPLRIPTDSLEDFLQGSAVPTSSAADVAQPAPGSSSGAGNRPTGEESA